MSLPTSRTPRASLRVRPGRPRPRPAGADRRRSRRRAGVLAAALTCAAALLTGLAGPATAKATADTARTSAVARVDIPYAGGATVYVNPEWSAHARAEPGGAAVADQPTAIWLDSIGSIAGAPGTMGLRDHLDAALAKGADVVQLVLYDLPGRDCQRQYTDAELGPDDLGRYETEFIDPIAAIVSDPAYAGLRITTVVEPNALESMVLYSNPTQLKSTFECRTILQNGAYVNGIGYALATLGSLPNVYAYLDAGAHGTVGWPEDAGPTLDMLHQAATASGSTVQDVAGFIVNTADYGVLQEPYLTSSTVNGTPILQSHWIDWNPFIDEPSFAASMRSRAVSLGFPSTIGILIDTSRNGWGGPARPTGPGPMTTVDAYVDGGRIDRRSTTLAWCNQAGAGLGERPTANPAPGVDAYVWAKPPGESDGASREGTRWDCDPQGDLYGGAHDGPAIPTGALPNAPERGQWFPAAFQILLANAWPAV